MDSLVTDCVDGAGTLDGMERLDRGNKRSRASVSESAEKPGLLIER